MTYFIISYLSNLEKAELTASIHHIVRFSKSGIPVYHFKVPRKAGRKTIKTRRTQAIANNMRFTLTQ